MIGQKNVQNTIQNLIDSNKFPRFSIFIGQFGSGRKMLAYQTAKNLGCIAIQIDCKMDSIRDMLEQCYKVAVPTMYIIADADNMSVNAKNAILKVTEEPPNNAYFVLTLTNAENTLATIRSRGQIFNMDIYTPDEIAMFVGSTTNEDVLYIYKNLCATPYDVQLLKSYNAEDFLGYVQLVVDNIAEVQGSNAFKIAQKIALDGESDKYDLILFWRAFIDECLNRASEDMERYAKGIKITAQYIQEIQRATALNKISTFDMWLLDIRSEWME